jgi:hypothetical protein
MLIILDCQGIKADSWDADGGKLQEQTRERDKQKLIMDTQS